MKTSSILLSFLVLFSLNARVEAQGLVATNNDSNLRVILLGTAGGPTFSAQRLGIVRWFWPDARNSCSTVGVG